ncbi:MAG: DUF2291 family protein [Vicinamibacterales bacterium]
MKYLLSFGIPIVLLAILRPWTVRSIGDDKPAGFDAASFPAVAWPKLLREATQTAVDVTSLPTESGAAPRARFVKGQGVVAAIDRAARVGLLRLQLPGDSRPTVALQIGPVIRGTALRDASSFIRFSDFRNQFDYAGSANALNDYALRTVVAQLPLDSLQGRTVTFIGAVGKSVPVDGGVWEIVPVQLDIVESGRK